MHTLFQGVERLRLNLHESFHIKSPWQVVECAKFFRFRIVPRKHSKLIEPKRCRKQTKIYCPPCSKASLLSTWLNASTTDEVNWIIQLRTSERVCFLDFIAAILKSREYSSNGIKTNLTEKPFLRSQTATSTNRNIEFCFHSFACNDAAFWSFRIT